MTLVCIHTYTHPSHWQLDEASIFYPSIQGLPHWLCFFFKPHLSLLHPQSAYIAPGHPRTWVDFFFWGGGVGGSAHISPLCTLKVISSASEHPPYLIFLLYFSLFCGILCFWIHYFIWTSQPVYEISKTSVSYHRGENQNLRREEWLVQVLGLIE